MFVITAVLFAATQPLLCAQEQILSTAVTTQTPHLPFFDLFTGASNLYPEPVRKAYSDSSYYVSCPKTDTLSSFANILGSAAKIMLSAATIVTLKLLAGKLLLFPLIFVLFVKMGLKAFLLWPIISKTIRHFKKKKRGHKPRMIAECTQRFACVIQRSMKSWISNIGAAITFSLVDDLDGDSVLAKSMLTILSGDKVAQCMSLDCNTGIDIS